MSELQNNQTLVKIFRNFKYVLLKRHVYGLTSSIRVLPDFFIIGVVRSGTTSMYHYLDEHPSIVKSAYDELGFFDDNFRLGWAWYKTLFPTTITKRIVKRKTGNFLTFDDTPFYIYNEDVAKKIKNYFPKTKLIIILRNPIDRAYSNYHLGVRMGDEKRTFDQAVDDEMQKIEEYNEIEMDDYISQSYLGRGIYAKQLEIWLKYFPASVIKILESERFSNDTEKTMNEVFEFLDLPNHNIRNLKKKNVAEYPPMRTETRQKLCNFFSEYNEKLYDMLKVRYDWR